MKGRWISGRPAITFPGQRAAEVTLKETEVVPPSKNIRPPPETGQAAAIIGDTDTTVATGSAAHGGGYKKRFLLEAFAASRQSIH